MSAICAKRKSRLTSGTAEITGEHHIIKSELAILHQERLCQQADSAALDAALSPGGGLHPLRPEAEAVARPGDGLHLRPVPVRELPGLGRGQVIRHRGKSTSDYFFFPSRYHCFPCDYTLCSDCARNIEAILRGSRNRKPTENFVKIDQKLLVFQS